MGTLEALLDVAKTKNASDIHIVKGEPPRYRQDGELHKTDFAVMTDELLEELFEECVSSQKQLRDEFEEAGEIDFARTSKSGIRIRVNIYKQEGNKAFAIRLLQSGVPTLRSLEAPRQLYGIADFTSGLVVVTGPTGSGKSTTLAAILHHINETRKCHILTLEDPIEYKHTSIQALVTQREIHVDSKSYGAALRASLRQDPDVILVGEMRDYESIAIAVQAAETGHLVLSTLHTLGASKTIDRVIGVFPADQQDQIRTQLAGTLRAVISQKLVGRADGVGRVAIHEIMVLTPAIANNIRSGNTSAIQDSISTGSEFGMLTMNQSLLSAVHGGLITEEAAMEASLNPEELKTMLG